MAIPKSDLGSAVTYRADLVVGPVELDEKFFRLWAMLPEVNPFDFLIIEPKGILTDSARIKHLALCASNKITLQQMLFVASNYADLAVPDVAKCSLFHLPTVLNKKLALIFGN
ncbi:hypothetical protein QUA71_28125 [Microcoleus sp. MON1_C5]|uniref:hypothetical protein n=1 Tax=Microcoleus sp. MON1_C5 TaxID=2818828 RepID=UPI002FCF721F